MNSFLRYAKNRFLYKVLKIALLIAIGFIASNFIIIVKVYAANLDSLAFLNRTQGNFPFVTDYATSYSDHYTAQYFLFSGTDNLPNYAIITTCATGPLSFTNLTPNSGSNLTYMGYVDLGGSCKVNDTYNGQVYVYYFNLISYTDAGNGNMGIDYSVDVTSGVSYNVFVKFTSISFSTASDFSTILQNQTLIQNQKDLSNKQQQTNDKLDQAENTRKSIWETIKNLPNAFLNMLKSLIIPDNFDFIYDFKDSLEDKLGFIASVPLQFIDYILSLPNKVFTPITSISFPEIEVFGTKFWSGQDIDISEGLSWFQGIKYFGDILCVILMVNTLNKWWKKFGGGNE